MDNPFKKLSKGQQYAALGGFVLIGGIFVVRQHSKTGSWNPFSSSTAATSSSAAATDPVTGLPYSDDNATDPQTGETYLAEATQYGSVAAAEASIEQYGQSTATGSGIPVNAASPASSGSINTPVGTSVYTSNAAWAQAVQAGLTDVGYNATDVAGALGLYLTQQPMSAAQAKLVNVAIAEYGPAPVGNLQVILAPSSGTGTTSTATGTVQVPDVTGQTAGNAHNILVNAGLTPEDPDASAPGEPQARVTATSPGAGTEVSKGSKVTIHAEPLAKVPDVIGKTAGQAHNAITAAGYVPEDANAGAKGEPSKKVRNQSPAAGTDAPRGTRVSIIT